MPAKRDNRSDPPEADIEYCPGGQSVRSSLPFRQGMIAPYGVSVTPRQIPFFGLRGGGRCGMMKQMKQYQKSGKMPPGMGGMGGFGR